MPRQRPGQHLADMSHLARGLSMGCPWPALSSEGADAELLRQERAAEPPVAVHRRARHAERLGDLRHGHSREHLALERRAQTAQIRLSTSVLSWIPLVICIWAITRQSHTRTFLLSTPLGLMCIAVGLLFNIAGRKWIARIARSSA
jgi:hypothetical protein